MNRDALLTLMCQQSRSGRGIDTQWFMKLLQIARSTALTKLEDMVNEKLLTRTEISWRSNALKFYYYPTDRVWEEYHAGCYKAEYLRYMRRLMEM